MLSLQQGHTGDSRLADSPQGFPCPFQQSYTPATETPACSAAWGYSIPGAGLHIYLLLKLAILVGLIFQPIKVSLCGGFSFWYIYFSSHFGVSHKIGEGALGPVNPDHL